MERLTKRLGSKGTVVFTQGKYEETIPAEMAVNETRIVLKKLCDYEDLEEQGLLMRLPVKIGDMIWDNDFGHPVSYEIKAFSYGFCDSYVEPNIEDEIIFYYENYNGSITGAFPMSEIGKTVFLTREEAENKFEELRFNFGEAQNGKKHLFYG